MSAKGKAEIIALVSQSGLSRSRALAQLRLPRSTYYRWLKRLSEGRLEDRKGGSPIPWNRIRPEEESEILAFRVLIHRIENRNQQKEVRYPSEPRFALAAP